MIAYGPVAIPTYEQLGIDSFLGPFCLSAAHFHAFSFSSHLVLD